MPGQSIAVHAEARPRNQKDAGPSPSDLATECGVNRSTALRWLRGDRAMPEWARLKLTELKEAHRSAGDRVVSVVRGNPGLTGPELAEALDRVQRRTLPELLSAGTLTFAPVEREDQTGRRYLRQGIFAGPGPAAAAAVRVPGPILSGARRFAGVSAAELADRIGLSPSTVRDMEAGPAIPPARAQQLGDALGLPGALYGDYIRAQRLRAGWSLGHLAGQLHTSYDVVRRWEVGEREIPQGYLIPLAAALHSANTESPAAMARRRQEL